MILLLAWAEVSVESAASQVLDQRMAVTRGGLRTREALLNAGRAIAVTDGVEAVTVGAVTTQAGVAKGTFYVHFADRDAFIGALRDSLNARARDAVTHAVRNLPPGERRLMVGIGAYLDACLADRSIKALKPGPTQADGDCTEARQHELIAMIEPNLRAMGWRDAATAARLLLATTIEVAVIEHDSGQKNTAARRALRRLLEGAGKPS